MPGLPGQKLTASGYRGGLTEWLRSSPGKRVGRNSLVGSSPMPSASEIECFSAFYFLWNKRGGKSHLLSGWVKFIANRMLPFNIKNSSDELLFFGKLCPGRRLHFIDENRRQTIWEYWYFWYTGSQASFFIDGYINRFYFLISDLENEIVAFKKLYRQRSVFPGDTALLKSLYLSTLQATKKWQQPLRKRAKVCEEFSESYMKADCLSEGPKVESSEALFGRSRLICLNLYLLLNALTRICHMGRFTSQLP